MQLPKTMQAWNTIDHIHIQSEEWRFRKVQLGSMWRYFQYAQVQVTDYENEYENLHSDFKPIKCVSYAIAGYGHMRTCLLFAEKITKSLSMDISEFKPWMKILITKRDRVQAHPNTYRKSKNEKDIQTINVYECILNKQDELRFPLWDQHRTKIEDSIEIILTPRKDLNELSKLLEFVSSKLLDHYQDDLRSLTR